MIVCGIAFGVLLIVYIGCRGMLTEGARRMVLVSAAGALLGGIYGIAMRGAPVLLEGDLLKRNVYGEGSYEQELLLRIGSGDEQSYSVTVPEERLTDGEEEAYLLAAVEELEAEFPGENASVNCIREKVVIRDSYQNGAVGAEWSFDPYRIVDANGIISEEALRQEEAAEDTESGGAYDGSEKSGSPAGDSEREGTLVRARVTLDCGGSQMKKEFYFQVYPALLGEEERLMRQIKDTLEEAGEERGTDVLPLPDMVGGQTLSWRAPGDNTPEKILLGGLVLAVFVPLLERSRQQEAKKKRARQLELEYPDMVSRMALLISAGMTLQGAWKRIAASYEEKRKQQALEEKPVFEEMLITCREMESGMGEQRAYERFGERCGLAAYRRFSNLLAQNLQKGSSGLVGLLEQEAGNAFEERKSAAKRFGEEAGTKLLIPMVMMLGIVMMILLVPAIFTFQI